jgi:riboflavin biosynthesis pyrimidine reductase
VNEAVFFIAPMILGGRQSIQAVAGDGFPEWRKAPMLRDFRLRKVGKDLMVAGLVGK